LVSVYHSVKSLFVPSSWSRLYLLIKDARSFEHKVKICVSKSPFNNYALFTEISFTRFVGFQ